MCECRALRSPNEDLFACDVTFAIICLAQSKHITGANARSRCSRALFALVVHRADGMCTNKERAMVHQCTLRPFKHISVVHASKLQACRMAQLVSSKAGFSAAVHVNHWVVCSSACDLCDGRLLWAKH